MTIDTRAARRLKLPAARGPFVAGRATWRLSSAGSATTLIKLNARARRALAHARRIHLTVVAAAKGAYPVQRGITLQR